MRLRLPFKLLAALWIAGCVAAVPGAAQMTVVPAQAARAAEDLSKYCGTPSAPVQSPGLTLAKPRKARWLQSPRLKNGRVIHHYYFTRSCAGYHA